MSKIFIIFVFTFYCSISFGADVPQESRGDHVKQKLHGKKIPGPVRNNEWYLSHIKNSDRFKAIALGNDGGKFTSEYKMVDLAVQQATISNQPIVENNMANEGILKKNSSMASSGKINFMFVPALPNLKLMGLQKNPETHPTFTIFWKE